MTSQNKIGKHHTESEAETTIIMMPSDANPKGNVFGGVILKYVDLIAGLVAKRHSGHVDVVTASIDRMTFLKPVFIGNALILSARLNYVRRSSMEVEVNVEARRSRRQYSSSHWDSFVTTVALDKYGKSTEVPPLIIENDDDKKRLTVNQEC